MAKAQKIRLLVADDHAILRSGLRMLINAQPDMMVVAEAQDGIEAVQAIQRAKPDVAILDVTMPRSGGLDAINEIVTRNRSTRVLLLTMHEEPAYLRTALAAGASGYVLKKSVDADLLSAIRSVHRGRTYVDSELADILVRDAFRADVPDRNGSVEAYRARFAEKLGLKSRAQIVRYALNLGLLSSEKFTVGKKRGKVQS